MDVQPQPNALLPGMATPTTPSVPEKVVKKVRVGRALLHAGCDKKHRSMATLEKCVRYARVRDARAGVTREDYRMLLARYKVRAESVWRHPFCGVGHRKERAFIACFWRTLSARVKAKPAVVRETRFGEGSVNAFLGLDDDVTTLTRKRVRGDE